MIQTKIDELFETIKNSNEYKAYQNIGEVLDKNEEIKSLVEEIKKLQQESVRLEEEGNLEYKEIDKIIDEKVKHDCTHYLFFISTCFYFSLFIKLLV